MTSYTGFDVAFRSTTLETATALSISSIFSSSATAGARRFALMFDALLTTDDVKKVTMPSGLSYLSCHGTGLRVAILVRSETADVKLNVSAVAAQTKLGLASASFKVEGIGVDSQVLAAFLGLPLSGTFDDKTYKVLRAAIATTLPDYLDSPTLGTGAYSVPLPTIQDDPAARARGVCYAAARVAQRVRLSSALSGKPASVSTEAIMVAYSRFAGSADLKLDSQPTTEHAERASRWLATGSF